VLGDLIRESLAAVPDVSVVRDIAAGRRPRRLASSLWWSRADVVVWPLADDSILVDHPELFGVRRGKAVLAVGDDGDRGVLWRLRPHRTHLGELSPSSLVAAVRAAGARP
jgi:hypothetical protein